MPPSPPSRLLTFLLVATAVLAAALAAPAHAQEENTTYTNVTVEVPKLPTITPAVRPEATVTASFNGSTVTVRYVCLYFTSPDKCPDLILRILAGDQVVKELGYRVNTSTDCGGDVCMYYVHIPLPANLTSVKLVYTLRYPDNTSRTYTLVLTNTTISSDVLRTLSTGIVFAIVTGMLLHENPFGVAVGAFAVPLILYLLAKVGLIELNFFIINGVIILALLLFFVTRGAKH